jgi:hypothetical protein
MHVSVSIVQDYFRVKGTRRLVIVGRVTLCAGFDIFVSAGDTFSLYVGAAPTKHEFGNWGLHG